MRVVALRYFTVYGPRQRPDLAIHQFTRRIYSGQPVDQFGDGTTRRDYTYIDDVIQGTMAALNYDRSPFDIFNLGESETIQLKDLIAAIEKALIFGLCRAHDMYAVPAAAEHRFLYRLLQFVLEGLTEIR